MFAIAGALSLLGLSATGQTPGSILWETTFTANLSVPPRASQNGKVAFVTTSGSLFGNNTNTLFLFNANGTKAWSTNFQNTSGQPISELLWHGETGVIVSMGVDLKYHNATNGRVRWTYRADQSGTPVVLDEDREEIYVSQGAKTVIISATTGGVIREIPGVNGIRMIGPAGKLFAYSGGDFRQFNQAGALEWKSTWGGSNPFSRTNQVQMDAQYFLWPSISYLDIGSAGGALVSIIDARSGAVTSVVTAQRNERAVGINRAAPGPELTALPFYTTTRSNVLFFSNRTRSEAANLTNVNVAVSFWDNANTYYFAQTNTLVGIDPYTGIEKFRFQGEGNITNGTIHPAGVIYLATASKHIYAVQALSAGYTVGSAANPGFIPGPMIASRLVPKKFRSGAPGSISVDVIGADNYQWFKGTEAITGGTNLTLSFDTVSNTDVGSYFLVASNSFRSLTSGPVQVEVDVPGSLAWETQTIARVYSTPIVLDEMVSVSTTFRGNPPMSAIQAFSAASGFALWSNDTQYPAIIRAAENGTILERPIFGGLFGLNSETGAKLWTNGLDLHETGAIIGGEAFGIASSDVIRMTLATGASSVLTSLPVSGFNSLGINNSLFIPAQGTNIYEVDSGTGLTTVHPLPGSVAFISAGNQGALYSPFGSRIVAYDPKAREVLWDKTFPEVVNQIVIDQHERLYTWMGNGLAAIDGRTGLLLWRYTNQTAFTSLPSAGDGEVYVADYDMISAFDSATGERLWDHHTDSAVYTAPVLDAVGNLYVANQTHLLKLTGVKPIAPSTWPMRDGDARSSRAVKINLELPPSVTISREGDVVLVRFNTTSQGRYELLVSENLHDWRIKENFVATGEIASFQITPNAPEGQFFKVRKL